MTIQPGRTLSHYRIVEKSGEGGMGMVYRARDLRLEREVALKVLPAGALADEAARKRFRQEALALSRLNHPNIATIHDFDSQDGVDFLVMEYLEGETRADRLHQGPRPPEQFRRAAAGIAEALAAAHRQGVVHRDLKPANIMLTRSGVKVLDFGLARLSEVTRPTAGAGLSALPTAADPLTAPGAIVGTLQYMAPEQLEGKDADARTDIFALGATLYEMATGRRAFSGPSQASLISAIMKEDPPPISSVRPLSPPALDHLVATCLAKDPAERWQSAADVRRALDGIGEGSAGAEAAPEAARRRPWLPWVVAAAAATVVALGALLTTRRPETPAAPRMILSILPPEGSAWTDWFALSPDGSRLAFVGSNKGGVQIWIRRLDEEQAHPLVGTEEAESPFWSPDGRSLGYFSRSRLKRIDLENGAIQDLCGAGQGWGGAWGRDSVILFSTSGGLFRVPSTGGAPAPATTLDTARGDLFHRWPYFLPDGERFLVFVWTFDPATTGIYQGSLASPTLRLVQPTHDSGQFVPPDRLLYVRGEALVAQRLDLDRGQVTGEPETLLRQVDAAEVAFVRLFSASRSGLIAFRDAGYQRPLVWLDRAGKVVRRTSALAGTMGLSLSPDETLAAYTSGIVTAADVWIIDLRRDVATKLTSGGISAQPLLSRDGRFLYYRVLGPKRLEIRRRPVRGDGAEETVFESETFETPQDETPDGKTLIVQNTARSYDISALPLTGDRRLVPLLASEYSERVPKLSPDGRWLAYYSDESGRFEVYVRRYPVTEEKWQISARGGAWPYWRGDGKEIYFVALDGALMAVPVSAGPGLSMGAPLALFQTRLSVWSAGRMQRQYVASRDGQRFLMIYPTEDTAASPLNVLLNWQAAPGPK